MNHIKHVSIIMDGNGRWGIKHKKSRNLGHKQGLKTVEEIIKATIKNKIKYLTLYAFSTENWKRPKIEIKFLLNLLEVFLKEKIQQLNNYEIKLKIIGDIKKFPKKIQNLLYLSEKKTSKNKKLQINLALNYGSKKEIIKAIKYIKKNKLKVNEKNIARSLYTKGIPDPDILIRTGGNNRLSNFILYNLTYTELFFTNTLWPDFNKQELLEIFNEYQKIERRYGL